MTQRTFFLDEKATRLLVKDAAEQVMNQLIIDRKIRLDEKQIKTLAKATAPHIGVDIDYKRIISTVTTENPLLNDAENLLTPNIRTDLIDKLKELIPEPVHGIDGKKGLNGKDGLHGLKGEDGKNYKLTKKDRVDIAEDTLKGEKVVDLIIDQIMARDEIVSRERFARKLRELKKLIKSVETGSKKGMNAGISGQDMIDEITKTFGSEVWQGGGGASAKVIFTTPKTGSETWSASQTEQTVLYDNNSSSFIFTLPKDADVSIPIGSWGVLKKVDVGDTGDITLRKGTTGGGSATVFNSPLGNVDIKLDSTGADGRSIMWVKRANNIYDISGDMKA